MTFDLTPSDSYMKFLEFISNRPQNNSQQNKPVNEKCNVTIIKKGSNNESLLK